MIKYEDWEKLQICNNGEISPKAVWNFWEDKKCTNCNYFLSTDCPVISTLIVRSDFSCNFWKIKE